MKTLSSLAIMSVCARVCPGTVALQRLQRRPLLFSYARPCRIGRLRAVGIQTDALSEITAEFLNTGVPVLNDLVGSAKTVDALLAKAVALSWESVLSVGVPLIASYICMAIILRWKDSNDGFLVQATASVTQPIQKYLPLYLVSNLVTIGNSVAHILLKKFQMSVFGYTHLADNAYVVAQFFQDLSEVLWVLLLVRASIQLKDVLLSQWQYLSQKEKKSEALGLGRFIDSIKSVSSVLIWMVGFYHGLLAWGFNPVPIWTSLGASSIIVGLAAQPFLSNVVSGIVIYTSRCLVVGDHIQLLTAGGAVAIDGFVEVISPTTCVIRDSDDCLIYVNNSQMSSMILRNKSQTVVMA